MIDLYSIEKYRENNRIEAKKALGGLPKSIWETYSAFANTIGGYILLGVEEYKDKSLHTVDLPNPENLVNEFWDIINNRRKVSVNILSCEDVSIEEVDGNHIIVIHVPRARRHDKPVYIDGNPLTGSYRRSGEGDYRCTMEDVQAMMRDAEINTQDMRILEKMDLNVFDYETVCRYRSRMKDIHPGHAWEGLEDVEFLYNIGVIGESGEGKLHPTAAGLLMFGYENEILKEHPGYLLDYQEKMDDNLLFTERIVSSSGGWSGNVYDFFINVYNRMTQDIEATYKAEGGDPAGDAPACTALREALANCLINADYYGRCGIEIIKEKDRVTITNPGGFRINIEDAMSGGISDPRNAALKKMFGIVNIGKCSGSGISDIYNVWDKQGWSIPEIIEEFKPERTIFKLGIKKEAVNISDYKEAIIAYLTDNVSATISVLAKLIGLKSSHIKTILKEMTEEDIIITENSRKDKIYKLKS